MDQSTEGEKIMAKKKKWADDQSYSEVEEK
jgi:hypothetical protein